MSPAQAVVPLRVQKPLQVWPLLQSESELHATPLSEQPFEVEVPFPLHVPLSGSLQSLSTVQLVLAFASQYLQSLAELQLLPLSATLSASVEALEESLQ